MPRFSCSFARSGDPSTSLAIKILWKLMPSIPLAQSFKQSLSILVRANQNGPAKTCHWKWVGLAHFNTGWGAIRQVTLEEPGRWKSTVGVVVSSWECRRCSSLSLATARTCCVNTENCLPWVSIPFNWWRELGSYKRYIILLRFWMTLWNCKNCVNTGKRFINLD